MTAIFILLLIALIICFYFLQPSQCLNRQDIRGNFELDFLNKVRDPTFYSKLKGNPKRVLQEEISQHIGRDFAFSDDVRVLVVEERPNDIHLMIPSQKPPGKGPLDQVIEALGEDKTFGLFMGNLDGIWWRLGLHNGSCMSDVMNEIREVKSRKCIKC
jgi:hypothetical protein